MNIDYIIDDYSVNNILKNEKPIFELKLNFKDLIIVYKLKEDLYIGVYNDESLDNQQYNNIERMDYTVQNIKKINKDCETLYNSFDVLIQNNIFENENDIIFYKKILDNRIKEKYNKFVNIVTELELDS